MGVVTVATRISQLQCKEVICIDSGQRLGFIEDVEVELPEGRVCALTVSGPGSLLGLGASKCTYCIPWNCIRRVGPDIVLVDADPDSCRISRPSRRIKG